MTITDEEIRIKVAEAMGWTGIRGETGYPTPRARELGDYQALPNYPVDLNAIHEAVMSLPTNKRDQFDVELAVVVHGDFIRHQVRYQRFETTNATARQRCLAYLKTKGLIP